MAVKIRLQRYGRKGLPYYHIVIADVTAPRDGRYVERIGSYNPLTSPVTIQVNTDKALAWLEKGAQPTDTVRSLLSSKGVMLKKHLLKGVKKGVMTAEDAERKLNEWAKVHEETLKRRESKKAGRKAEKKKKEKEAKEKEAQPAAVQAKAPEAAPAPDSAPVAEAPAPQADVPPSAAPADSVPTAPEATPAADTPPAAPAGEAS